MSDLRSDLIARLHRVPHARALGIEMISISASHCELSMPYNEQLVGDPDTGVIHGGAVTALLDNVAGIIAWTSGGDLETAAVATLDLRIDYLRPATPRMALRVRAECYKRTTNIAFVRGLAFHESPDRPIAVCTAAFMVGTPNAALPESSP